MLRACNYTMKRCEAKQIVCILKPDCAASVAAPGQDNSPGGLLNPLVFNNY